MQVPQEEREGFNQLVVATTTRQLKDVANERPRWLFLGFRNSITLRRNPVPEADDDLILVTLPLSDKPAPRACRLMADNNVYILMKRKRVGIFAVRDADNVAFSVWIRVLGEVVDEVDDTNSGRFRRFRHD